MASIGEHYALAFSSERFFGLEMVINWVSLIIVLWIIGLAYLVWRSDSNNLRNRFMATLLLCEGLKGLWQAVNIVPYSNQFQHIWDYTWILKIDVFFTAQIAALFLYLLFPVYFKIDRLKFMYRKSLQKYAWCIAPILALIVWLVIKDLPPFTLQNASWLSCAGPGAEPQLHVWYGQITAEAESIRQGIGVCTTTVDSLVSDQQVALWAITLMGTPISIVALLLIRSSMKRETEESETQESALTTQTLYKGFLGKVIINTVFFSTFLVFIPLLNGGPAGFTELLEWRTVDKTFMSKLKYFIFTINLALPIVAVGFEAMMFVFASLNETVSGIDQNLRKTFTNTTFTGLGAILFIVASEVIENVYGFGLAGGVVLGVGLLAVRKPVTGIIYGFSNRLIPTTYAKEEMDYLELYSKSIKDGEITDNERALLVSLASAFGIDDERVNELESDFLHQSVVQEAE